MKLVNWISKSQEETTQLLWATWRLWDLEASRNAWCQWANNSSGLSNGLQLLITASTTLKNQTNVFSFPLVWFLFWYPFLWLPFVFIKAMIKNNEDSICSSFESWMPNFLEPNKSSKRIGRCSLQWTTCRTWRLSTKTNASRRNKTK